MRQYTAFILMLLTCSIQGYAQDRKPWVLRVLNSVKTYIDSSAVKGIDPRYIEVPEKPWAVVLKYNTNHMDLQSTSFLSKERLAEKDINGEFSWESTFRPKNEISLGAWIGYRGYGFGYSYSLQRTAGRNFSIGATGSNYGLNLRIRRFKTHEIGAHYWGYDDDGKFDENWQDAETWGDIMVRSAIFNGFYMLNGKHFSYAAAYDQSVNQIRSAGSLMLGVMWFQTSLDFSSPTNGLLIQMLGDVGRVKIHEGSIGIGYAYNWVPMKNLLINVTAMPMLSLYNRTKTYFYDCNYDIFLEEGDVSPKGKKVVPEDDSWTEDITLTERDTNVSYGKVSLNIDARASITYQFDRFFLNIYGQVNNFRHSVDNNELKLTDWYVNAALGVRF